MTTLQDYGKLIPALALLGAMAAAAPASTTWTPINNGIPVASYGVTRFTIDPLTPSTLYAITNTGAIFRSTDSAGSWEPVLGVARAQSLTVDPKNPSTLYVSSQNGIFTSTDAGATWSGINSGLAGKGASLVVIDPVQTSKLYSLVDGLLYKSANAGQSWRAIETIAGPQRILGFLTIDPVTPSTLYAVKFNGDILKSIDEAETWTSLRGPQGAGFSNPMLIIDPRTPATLYAAFSGLIPPGGPFDNGEGSISKSTDGGQSWTVIRTGIPGGTFVGGLSIDPADPQIVYASYSGDGAGILRSADGGQSWKVVTTSADTRVSPIVAVGGGSIVYAGYSSYGTGAGAVLKSADGGSSWNAANTGLDYYDLRDLKVDPVHPGVVYTAGTAGVLRSADGGGTWTRLATLPGGPPSPFFFSAPIVRSLLVDPANPNNLYVEANRLGGCHFADRLVFKSVDGGASWSDSISPPDSGCLVSGWLGVGGGFMAIDPVDPRVLYLQEVDGEDGFLSLLRSADGGDHWTAIWADQASPLYTLLIDPVDPAVLYAGTFSGVLKSSDSGTTWTPAGLDQFPVTVLAMDPSDSGILYAAADTGGLFKSTDGAATWIPVSQSLSTVATVTAVVGAPHQSNLIYMATSGDGIYQSTDGGANWSRFNAGLKSLDVKSLAFDPQTSGTLYSATAAGIFKIAGESTGNREGK